MGQFAPADLAIDLGTSNTRVYVRKKGIVINEPSVVALDTDRGGRVIAVGDAAEEIAGRAESHIRLLSPVQQGKIIDLETAQLMLQYFVNKAIGSIRMKPRVIAAKTIGSTRMEESILRRTIESIGCKTMVIVDSVIASAVGAGLAISEPQGSFIVDIGAGKTEIALVSMGGIVLSHCVPIGGKQIDQSIVEHIRREYDLTIVERTAEQMKFDLVDVRRTENTDRFSIVRGRDLATGMPTTAEVDLNGISDAVGGVLQGILEAIKWVLSRTPPELCADILKGGIVICGGSASLPKLDVLISDAFGIPAVLAREAGECAVLGAGYMADHFEIYGGTGERRNTQS